nr:TIGR04255 family protein [Rhizobium halophytocola]
MVFRPINDDHAIESIKFSVMFTTALSPNAIVAIDQSHEKWRDSLPARTPLEVEIDVGGREVKLPGLVFSFMKPDGNPTWSMTVGGNKIEIECFLYSRWQRVWNSVLRILQNALSAISALKDNLLISSVELAVRDTFITQDPDYALDQLMNRCRFVPEWAFKAGRSWHSHIGWMGDFAERSRTLHNLNADVVPRESETYIKVTHYQLRNTGTDLKVQELIDSNLAQLDVMFNNLHDVNKNIMSELITKKMGQRIGLSSDHEHF